jgi:two-component system phosphate regulon sensor histidine kinase PhoR
VIQQETERLSDLIARLLSWGAMESGAFRLDREPRHPGDIVKAAIEAFEPQLIHSEGKLDVRIEDNLPMVEADQQAMVDAILNLLTNALRYGGKEKRIEVRVAARDGKVGIAVEDHGIGIDPKDQKRIFERFYRADERYSRAVGGTGLGLAIARHVITGHGGTIEVRSKLGEGSTFTIFLPVAAGRAPEVVVTEERGAESA